MRTTVKGAALALVAALATTVTAVLAIVLPAGSANAATYPPSTCATISVSTTTPDVGQSITVTGEQFLASIPVTLYLTPKADYPGGSTTGKPAGSSILLTTVTSDANGSYSTQVTMPANAEGNQIISASSKGKICPADPIQIQVGQGAGGGGSSSGSGGGQPPAMTGTDIGLLVALALVLLTAGALFARSGKRRHATARH